jgi:hypothetical protein
MTKTSGNCCCNKYWKADPVESLSRIGEQAGNYGLYLNKTYYDAADYTTGHIFRDPHNFCFGPVLTDRMKNALMPSTGVDAGGINYDDFTANFSDKDESGNNFGNCEDCLLYHLRHKNVKDGTSSPGSYGRLYAVLCMCDCNDYFQFNVDARGDAPNNAAFKRFTWPGCEAEEVGYDVSEAYPDCPDGGTEVSDNTYLTDISKDYDESATSKQDGLPHPDMTRRFFYIDYTPLLEEVKNSNHPQYLNPGASVSGESYNIPDHTAIGTQPNSTLKTVGGITFASDATNKANVEWTYTGTSEARVPLNFFSGSNRSSTRFTFDGTSSYSSITSDTTVTLESTDGTSKVYKAVTGSPTASNREFQAVTSAATTAANFKAIVENDDHGHGKLKLHVEVDGGIVTIIQTEEGEAGDKAIAHHATFDSITTENIPTAFIGGSDASDNFMNIDNNKGTFLIMDMDPKIDTGTANTARRINRSFKIVGFTQYKPEVGGAYQAAYGAINEIPLTHIYGMHFRMNPQDSSKFYGCEAAIAEGNGSFCADTSNSPAANTLQLGTTKIGDYINEDADATSGRWQGSSPCTRSIVTNASHGAKMSAEDFGKHCKNSNNLPPEIKIVRKFDCTSNDSPWRHFVTLESFVGTANGASGDTEPTTAYGCPKEQFGRASCDDPEGGSRDYTNGCVKNVTISPWGDYTGGMEQRELGATDLKLEFTYTLGSDRDACGNYIPVNINNFYYSRSEHGSFMAPHTTTGSIADGDTEPYMCHYYLSNIEILDRQNHSDFDWSTWDDIAQVAQRNRLLWIQDPYLRIASKQPNDGLNQGTAILDRRFVVDSACSIKDLHNNINGNILGDQENWHRFSSSVDQYAGGIGGVFWDDDYLDWIVSFANPAGIETTRGIAGHYVYGGHLGKALNEAVFNNTICGSPCNGLNPSRHRGFNTVGHHEYQQPCLEQGDPDPTDSSYEGDKADVKGNLNCLPAYIGTGIGKYAPDWELKKFNAASEYSASWADAQAEGHTFMPTFTIGIPHCLNRKQCARPNEKAKYDVFCTIPPGGKECIPRKIYDVPHSLCSCAEDFGETCSRAYSEAIQLIHERTCTEPACPMKCGEAYNNSLYEYSTYIIPAGIYIKSIDACADESENNTANGDTRSNKCIFALSLPIRESEVNAGTEVLEWWEGFYRSFSVPVTQCMEKSLLKIEWDSGSEFFKDGSFCTGAIGSAWGITDSESRRLGLGDIGVFFACNNFGLLNGERANPNAIDPFSSAVGWCYQNEDSSAEEFDDEVSCTTRQLMRCIRAGDYKGDDGALQLTASRKTGESCICKTAECVQGGYNTSCSGPGYGGQNGCIEYCCGAQGCAYATRGEDHGPPNHYISGISERFETNTAADGCKNIQPFFLNSFFHKNANKYRYARIIGTNTDSSLLKYCQDKAQADAEAAHPGPCISFFATYNSNEHSGKPNFSTSHGLIHLADLSDTGCDDNTSLGDLLTYYKSIGT